MFCPKCGTQLDDNARFCAACGEQLGAEEVNSSGAGQNYAPTQPQYAPEYQYPVRSAGKGVSPAVVAVITVAVIAVLAVVGYFLFFSDNAPFGTGNDEVSISVPVIESDGDEEAATEEKELEEEAPRVDIETPVNNLISSYGLVNDVAVAVVDNLTGERYLCNGSGMAYTSWGFYLPAYMALCDTYPTGYDSYKSDIMSSDAAKCNTAANFAIDTLGGLGGINNCISTNYGYTVTRFGRKFGETNAYGDNYTSAAEAVDLMQRLNDKGEYYKFCYNPSAFGVSAPAGATMYAQLGTENRNVMQNLNVFAIVKGANSDYCIAVMTKNKASATGIVNDIINTVYYTLEG